MSDRYDVEYLEVGDSFEGGPIEQGYFISAILAAGGEVEIHGNKVIIVNLPGKEKKEEIKAKALESFKPEAPKAEEPKAEEPKAEEPKAEEPKAEEPKAEEPKAEEPDPEIAIAPAPTAEEPVEAVEVVEAPKTKFTRKPKATTATKKIEE